MTFYSLSNNRMMNKKITRNKFIKQVANIGTVAMVAPYSAKLIAGTSGSRSQSFPSAPDEAILKRLSDANDEQTARILQQDGAGRGRAPAHGTAILASSYSFPGSKYYKSPEIPPKLEQMAAALLAAQTPDGTLGGAGNIESPPDTAFVLEPLCAGVTVLMKNDDPALNKAKEEYRKFIVHAGDALTTGGGHTPNHRWAICSALSWINSLFPDRKYVVRVNEWLMDGVYQDSDGHYPERSRNYSEVEDNSMVTIGRLMNKPELFEYVRKNLAMTWYYMEPDGDLIANDSRRQDQGRYKPMPAYYLHYRYMANYDKDPNFAAIAKRIESLDRFKEEILNVHFADILAEPLLQEKLPEANPLETDFEKLFTTSHLLRIRRQDKTMTLYGGADWPILVASGRAHNPDFFSYRNGEAILKAIRMSAGFFSMGFFYSDGLTKNGNEYILHKKLEVPYYQPMSPERRDPDGDYALTPSMNRRFWSKLDFPNRPVSNVKTLDYTVILKEDNGNAELNFKVSGQAGIRTTIELNFEEGGELSGVTKYDPQADENNFYRRYRPQEPQDNYFLEDGVMGQYSYGEKTIQFGPGMGTPRWVGGLEGEQYGHYRGSARTNGMHVYLTGVTPFEHKIRFS